MIVGIAVVARRFLTWPAEMDTILDKSKATTPSSSSSIAIKAASVPLCPPVEPPPQVKTQVSAPSYLFSLKDSDAPPFQKPGKWPRPQLLIGKIMDRNDAIEMVAANDADKVYGLRNWLGEFLIKKRIIRNYDLSEKAFLISLVTELVDYAAQRDFTAFKLAVLITIYLSTHVFFKFHYWSSPESVWYYFKDVMIRHTIQNSPDGEEVFSAEECFDIMTHFHTVYLSNLPLVHIVCFGVYRLKLLWPFKPK